MVGLATCVTGAAAWAVQARQASAHGVLGKRFFPSTLVIHDPFASDELSLLYSRIKEPGSEEEPATVEDEFSVEYSKRIFPGFAIGVEGEWRHRNPDGDEEQESGFANPAVNAALEIFRNAPHEAIVTLGFEANLGHIGSRDIEAEPYTTLSPSILFGKGMGDLPDGLKFLRPFAVTGVVGVGVPLKSTTRNVHTHFDEETFETEVEVEVEHNPTVLNWGGTLQYNLQYLQSAVQDIGLGAPFNRMVPLVEVALATGLNDESGRDTTGTVNPGVVWFGKTFQLGLEAQIPVNERSGQNVGVRAQLHFFIDDLFPGSLGKPIFE
jgi:hypothetical protein